MTYPASGDLVEVDHAQLVAMVMRINQLEADLLQVRLLLRHARKVSPSDRAVVYARDLERALGDELPEVRDRNG